MHKYSIVCLDFIIVLKGKKHERKLFRASESVLRFPIELLISALSELFTQGDKVLGDLEDFIIGEVSFELERAGVELILWIVDLLVDLFRFFLGEQRPQTPSRSKASICEPSVPERVRCPWPVW